MSIQDSVGVYDQAEFAENPESRCPIVLILDVSGSMIGLKIQTVNQALVRFGEIIRDDPVAALRADVAIIAFDDVAWVVQDFTNGTDFQPPILEVHGDTNFSQPINMALDLIEARKQSYRDSGIAYYRSLAYFLTDGVPGDDSADLERTARRLAAAEQDRSIAFFSFMIGGGDIPNWSVPPGQVSNFYQFIGKSYEELVAVGAFGDYVESGRGLDLLRVAEMCDASVTELVNRCVEAGVIRTGVDELTKLSPRPPVELTNMAQLEGSVQWLSRSVTAVSQSQVGDRIQLPPTDYLNF